MVTWWLCPAIAWRTWEQIWTQWNGRHDFFKRSLWVNFSPQHVDSIMLQTQLTQHSASGPTRAGCRSWHEACLVWYVPADSPRRPTGNRPEAFLFLEWESYEIWKYIERTLVSLCQTIGRWQTEFIINLSSADGWSSTFRAPDNLRPMDVCFPFN